MFLIIYLFLQLHIKQECGHVIVFCPNGCGEKLPKREVADFKMFDQVLSIITLSGVGLLVECHVSQTRVWTDVCTRALV